MNKKCPYFNKINPINTSYVQTYCGGYASGKLRVPNLDEEINYCEHNSNYKECNTYQFTEADWVP